MEHSGTGCRWRALLSKVTLSWSCVEIYWRRVQQSVAAHGMMEKYWLLTFFLKMKTIWVCLAALMHQLLFFSISKELLNKCLLSWSRLVLRNQFRTEILRIITSKHPVCQITGVISTEYGRKICITMFLLGVLVYYVWSPPCFGIVSLRCKLDGKVLKTRKTRSNNLNSISSLVQMKCNMWRKM